MIIKLTKNGVSNFLDAQQSQLEGFESAGYAVDVMPEYINNRAKEFDISGLSAKDISTELIDAIGKSSSFEELKELLTPLQMKRQAVKDKFPKQ